MFNIKLKEFVLFIFVVLITTSCSDNDNPTGGSLELEDGLTISFPESYIDGVAIIVAEGSDDEDHGNEDDSHFIPAGFQFEVEGQDNYVYRELNLAPEGSITVSIAEGPKELTLYFLDAEGDKLDHGDHEEEHGMHIEITGLSLGTTFFQIQLIHDGHSDFTSLGPPTEINGTLYNGIPVIITE